MLLVNGVFCSPDASGEGTGAFFGMSEIPWDADSEGGTVDSCNAFNLPTEKLSSFMSCIRMIAIGLTFRCNFSVLDLV